MTVLCTLHVPVTRQTRQPVLRHCYCPLSRQSTVKRHRGEPGHTRDTLGTRGPAGAQGHTDHNDEPHNHPNPPTHNPHVSEPVTRCVPCVSRLCLFTVPVKRHRGQPGHTRDTRDTRTHKGTRTTQTNLTTIQTHQQHTVPVPNSTGTPAPPGVFLPVKRGSPRCLFTGKTRPNLVLVRSKTLSTRARPRGKHTNARRAEHEGLAGPLQGKG